MYKVLLWDIDGTVLNFLKSESYAIRCTFSELGICENISDGEIAEYSKINQKYWLMLEKGMINKREVQNGRFREFFELKGIDFTDLDGLNVIYQHYLGEKFFYNDGAREMLTKLKGSYRQYAITNGSKSVQTKKLKKAGLTDILDGMFISDEIGYEKPDERFFDAVLSSVGECARDEMLIIGDSLTSDIKLANNVGVPCVWYNPDGAVCEKDLRIDYQISSFSELNGIL